MKFLTCKCKATGTVGAPVATHKTLGPKLQTVNGNIHGDKCTFERISNKRCRICSSDTGRAGGVYRCKDFFRPDVILSKN